MKSTTTNLKYSLSSFFESPEIQEKFENELIKSLNAISFNGARKIFTVGQHGGSTTLRINTFRGLPREHFKINFEQIGRLVLDKAENPFSEV